MQTDYMEEGETLTDFANRLYTNGLWRVIAVSAMLDVLVYRADDLLRKRDGDAEIDGWRAAMLDYYDKFVARTKDFTHAEEDVLMDFKAHFGKQISRKLSSLINCVVKAGKKVGEKEPEVVAVLACYLKMAEVCADVWEEQLKPLGAVARKMLPDKVDRSFILLKWSCDKASRLLVALDTAETENEEDNPTADKLFEDLLGYLINFKAINKSLDYSMKENGKKPAT